jgi:hypothetical protein
LFPNLLPSLCAITNLNLVPLLGLGWRERERDLDGEKKRELGKNNTQLL